MDKFNRSHAIGSVSGTHKALPLGMVGVKSAPLIYLNTPKSACSTIKNHLYFIEHGKYAHDPLAIHSNSGLLRTKDAGLDVVQHFENVLSQPHLIFSFVREPGRRAYSCFSEKIVHKSKYSFQKIRAYLVDAYGLKLEHIESSTYSLEAHAENFAKYLRFIRDNLAGKTSVRVDPHWCSQSEIIRGYQKHFCIDFVGRVENFERHFSFITSEFDLKHRPDFKLRFNEGPRPPFNFESILSNEVRGLLTDIYGADYRDFGYPSSA